MIAGRLLPTGAKANMRIRSTIASPMLRVAARVRARGGARFETLEQRRLLSTSVLAWRNDLAGDGTNGAETTLTPANVAGGSFGQLSSQPVDGQVYAQPLVDASVNITAGSHRGTQGVVFVATENNSVYALNAQSGVLLWKTSVNDGGEAVPTADLHTEDMTVQAGITSTPVIDPAIGCIYVVDSTLTSTGGNQHFKITLHALNLGNGTEAQGGPKLIADTICNNPTSNNPTYTVVSGPTVNGNGVESARGVVLFNAVTCNQRSALQIVNGKLYIANSSHSDFGPYHGWVLGYDPATLAPTAVFNVTPNGSDGGIWMSGAGITADAAGNLYLTVGNGTFDTTLNSAGFPSQGDYGEALLKLAPDNTTSSTHQNVNGWGLKVVDYFVPSNAVTLTNADADVSTNALLLPASAATSSVPLVVFADKGGTVYVANANHLGHFSPSGDTLVQKFTERSGFWSSPAYFDGHLYLTPQGGKTLELAVSGGHVNTTPISSSTATYAFPGTNASVSANGTANGIVWQIEHGTSSLIAYSAANLGTPLFSASLGSSNKFTPVTVANGLVYAATAGALDLFGLRQHVNQPVANGTYTLTNVYDGLRLDDPGASKAPGTQMIQWTADGGANQRWTFNYNGAGYYTITNASSGLVLDDPGASAKPGVKLEQWPANGGANQLWSLTPLDGGYVIQNKASGLVIDDTAHSTAIGNPMQLYTSSGYQWQAWKFG